MSKNNKRRRNSTIKRTPYKYAKLNQKTNRTELKAFDVTQTTLPALTPIITTASVVLNAIDKGSEPYDRIGRAINLQSLRLRGKVVPSAATAIALDTMVRLIVFYDRQPNGVSTKATELLQNSNSANSTTMTSSINLNNRDRFIILRDQQLVLGPGTQGAGFLVQDNLNTINIDWFIKLKGLESIYNQVDASTIADINTGALNLMFISDVASSVDFIFSSRVRFIE